MTKDRRSKGRFALPIVLGILSGILLALGILSPSSTEILLTPEEALESQDANSGEDPEIEPAAPAVATVSRGYRILWPEETARGTDSEKEPTAAEPGAEPVADEPAPEDPEAEPAPAAARFEKEPPTPKPAVGWHPGDPHHANPDWDALPAPKEDPKKPVKRKEEPGERPEDD